ncbi:MAG: flagellar basal body L-ring protein FlgH [Hyphomicrobiales bacterium]|nr:flagellar basal body L-ring protein FlgH [Hyphomicrobiales bacterium]
MNTNSTARPLMRMTAMISLVVLASGCQMFQRATDLAEGGPQLSDIENPQQQSNYQPVSLPMPYPQPIEDNPNSLWRPGAKAFFKDIRAKEVGDTVTVHLRLDDSAKLENKTERSRNGGESADLNAILGYAPQLATLIPALDTTSAVLDIASDSQTAGDGGIDRSEEIELTLAAMVTQVLPNGSLVIMGRQEIRVNSELRELRVRGVVRPQDIEADNTISHERIAEMRVAYGGRGMLSDLQQPRWGTQVLDIIFPF